MPPLRTLWRTLAVLLAASCGVAAFGTIAPLPEAGLPPPAQALVEPLELRAQPLEAPASYIREERFQRGDTLPGLLARLGIAEAYAARLARLKALRELRPGTPVGAEVDPDGAPLEISFLERERLVRIRAEESGYTVSEERAQFETSLAMRSSVIRSSLFAASDAAGIPDGVAMQLADVFGGDIDFYRDLRRDDRFTVVYEVHSLLGRPVRAGRLLAAEFVNQGKTLRAIYYATGYYTPEGKNLRKAFLRSPLEFSRVSSGFGMRMHPLAREWRAHKGIDYAAPVGTRVRSVGDGVVEFAGRQGGYGNVVVVRHHGQYSTLYAHLSRFASGVRKGARIGQNDTIGFVGQTGWATGPHLHYEFKVAGVARNPLSIAMPAALPVPPRELDAFRGHAEPLVARLELLAAGDVALLD